MDIISVSRKLSVKLSDDKWEEFALCLLQQTSIEDVETDVGMIKNACKGETEVAVAKCKSLLTKWKQSSIKPQWEQVIEVLNYVKEVQFATELLEALMRGQQGNVYNKNMVYSDLHAIQCFLSVTQFICSI